MQNEIKYCSGYKYQLVEDYFHILPPDFDKIKSFDFGFLNWNPSILMIRKGYAWDGASGIAIDTKDFMRGSLVHDALYQCMRQGLIKINYKDACDKELERILLEDKMASFRASYVYQAVRIFGYSSAIEPKEIQVAP